MNIPKNHHYVSQVHIRNFFNNDKKKIFVFDKFLQNHYFKTSTKSLFSENELNSKFYEGNVDHISIEKHLNDYFEKDFAFYTKVIKQFISDRVYNDEVKNALLYIAKYGIIGDIRTPRNKKHTDDSIFNAFKEIAECATDELKTEINEMLKFKEVVKYSNVLEYKELAETIISVMGNLIFQIHIPENEDDYFVLPDFSAVTVRMKINTYFNPDVKEIAYIGIPLTSKIYIHFHSEKIYKKMHIPESRITFCDSEVVRIFNKANLDYCQSKIACENENYLKSFIKKI